ncbi:MAG: ferritin family protein [Clostridia bacterium]|nr:ferritin family protein [Clostridia bacterium]
MNKIESILKFAIRMEKDAGDFYSYYIDKVKCPSTKELFIELVETERQHYNVLKAKFDQLGFTEPPLSVSWVVDNSSAARDPHILADNSFLADSYENPISDLSIIRMAYLIESDFALFYKNAVNLVNDNETKKFLSSLGDWEKQHRDMFYKKYQNLLKEHWSDISSIIFAEK